MLLAVDLGLRAGLAWYDTAGRLQSYRSTNFGANARLKQGAYRMMQEHPELSWVMLEGDHNLAEAWMRHAKKQRAHSQCISAETCAACHRMVRRSASHLAPPRRCRSHLHRAVERA